MENFNICLTYVSGENNKYWKVEKAIKVVLSDGSDLEVPKGFKTDLSTVPKLLWGIFPPYGNFIIAAIVHDYLYVIQDERGKAFADREMLCLSNKHNNNKVDNYLRYLAVRIFGSLYWKNVVK